MNLFSLISEYAQGLTLSERWLILAILNHENTELLPGKANLICSLTILERLSGLSKSTVRRSVDELKDKNVLVIVTNSEGRLYTINLTNHHFRGAHFEHPIKKDRGGLPILNTPKRGGTAHFEHPYINYKSKFSSKNTQFAKPLYVKRAHTYINININNNITKLCNFFGEYENLSLSGNIPEKPAIKKKPVKFEEECNIVLAHFSKKSGVKYRGSKAYLPLIRGRMSDGATVDEMIRVIDSRFEAWWSDDYMRQHFNPTTLFRPTNFFKYLAAVEVEGSHEAEQSKIRQSQVKTLPELFVTGVPGHVGWSINPDLPPLLQRSIDDAFYRIGKRFPDLTFQQAVEKFKDKMQPKKPS